MVVCDMPFLSYQISPEDALRNCGRAIEGNGCNAVKIEGWAADGGNVRRLWRSASRHGSPGLTPNRCTPWAAIAVQGATDAEAGASTDATRVQDAGAFAVVLELVPAPLASQITKSLAIPTVVDRRRAGSTDRSWCCTTCSGSTNQFSAKFVKSTRRLAEDVGRRPRSSSRRRSGVPLPRTGASFGK